MLLLSLVGCPTNSALPGETETGGASSSETTVDPTETTAAALCGDGMVVAPEECDDGNDVDDDECTNICTKPACGDNILQSGEICDQGSNNTEAPWTAKQRCQADCQGYADYCGDGTCQAEFEDAESCPDDPCTSVCGDGMVEGDEVCDDGTTDNMGECVANCTMEATCGDGFVRAGMEECDDANGANDDACVDGCKAAVCGDGFIQAGVEDCDDANDDENDECDAQCKVVEHRRVFVTSFQYAGDLGGFSGDTICQVLGTTQKYKAWLADGAQGPADRLDVTFTGVYELTNGEFVAKGWADLTDGSLAHAIDQTESGMTVAEGAVWTNSTAAGAPIGAEHCGNWMSKMFASDGAVGNSSETTELWTDAKKVLPCSSLARLYCFEDL